MNNTRIPLLKVLVGSRAHGLADEQSDWDYRSVHVVPTSELLQLGVKVGAHTWNEGPDQDVVSYEIGHFLFLATKSNPSILEMFKAPMLGEAATQEALDMLNLFPLVWSSKGVYDSHRGYGYNQRKKLLDDPRGARSGKYASAWLRTLYNATCLLRTGDFHLSVKDTIIEFTLRRWRAEGIKDPGEVISICLDWEERLTEAYESNPNKVSDVDAINAYLLRIRKDYWE